MVEMEYVFFYFTVLLYRKIERKRKVKVHRRPFAKMNRWGKNFLRQLMSNNNNKYFQEGLRCIRKMNPFAFSMKICSLHYITRIL